MTHYQTRCIILSVKNILIDRNIASITGLGYSEREARVYLAALQLGGGTVSEVAKAANLERTGIYYYIDRLLEHGLLRTADRRKRTIYLAADPERLQVIEAERKQGLERIMPDLQEQFSRDTNKSIIEYFQGKEEVDAFYDRLYLLLKGLQAPQNTVYVFGQSYQAVSSRYRNFQKYHQPKERIDVRVKAILAKSQESGERTVNTKDPYIVTRFNLPPAELKYIDDRYTYPSAVVLFENKVAFVDFQNYFYSITENANTAATWRLFFEYIWNHLDKRSPRDSSLLDN